MSDFYAVLDGITRRAAAPLCVRLPCLLQRQRRLALRVTQLIRAELDPMHCYAGLQYDPDSVLTGIASHAFRNSAGLQSQQAFTSSSAKQLIYDRACSWHAPSLCWWLMMLRLLSRWLTNMAAHCQPHYNPRWLECCRRHPAEKGAQGSRDQQERPAKPSMFIPSAQLSISTACLERRPLARPLSPTKMGL